MRQAHPGHRGTPRTTARSSATLLTSFDYELIEAVDGAEGVAMAGDPSPRPDPDGHPAPGHRRLRRRTRQIRAIPELARVPIIARNLLCPFGRRGQDAGRPVATGYIAKTLQPAPAPSPRSANSSRNKKKTL